MGLSNLAASGAVDAVGFCEATLEVMKELEQPSDKAYTSTETRNEIPGLYDHLRGILELFDADAARDEQLAVFVLPIVCRRCW